VIKVAVAGGVAIYLFCVVLAAAGFTSIVPLVVIVHFRDGKLAHEHIYWDQASVLKQIGLLTDPSLPVRGVETAQKVRGELA